MCDKTIRRCKDSGESFSAVVVLRWRIQYFNKFGAQSSTNAKDTSVEIAWALRMGLVKTGESLQVPLGGRTYCNCCMRPLQVSCDQYNPVSSTVGVCQAESTNY